MLDIGWTELVVIAIVMIIVVGPKDLPPMLRAFGKMMTKVRGMASDFRNQFDEALKEADLDEVRKTIHDARKLNPANSIREAMNPLRQMGNDLKADLQKATTDLKPDPSAPVASSVSEDAAAPVPLSPSTSPFPTVAVVAAPVSREPAAIVAPATAAVPDPAAPVPGAAVAKAAKAGKATKAKIATEMPGTGDPAVKVTKPKARKIKAAQDGKDEA